MSSLNEGAKVSYEIVANRGKELAENSQGRLEPEFSVETFREISRHTFHLVQLAAIAPSQPCATRLRFFLNGRQGRADCRKFA